MEEDEKIIQICTSDQVSGSSDDIMTDEYLYMLTNKGNVYYKNYWEGEGYKIRKFCDMDEIRREAGK